MLKILAKGFTFEEMLVLEHLLFPFKAELVESNSTAFDVVISRGVESKEANALQIIIPENEAGPGEVAGLLESSNNGIVRLPYDMVSQCLQKFGSVLNPKVSLKYSFSTKLPFGYNIVPPSLRSQLLKTQKGTNVLSSDLSKHLAVEVARKLLAKSFEMLGAPLERKRPPAIYLTHDVDTEKGLARAVSMKQVEDEVGFSSIWFIVSHEYPIKSELLRELSNGSELGSHDRRHDGKLIHIANYEKLVSRLRTSKARLEELSGKQVSNFRSPLLQFSKRIISALDTAGYESDFSLPCWEPVHPSTMSDYGVESAQAMRFGKIVEHPLTLYQDHQVFNILGLSPNEATKLWLEQSRILNSYDGDLVLLIHPDYAYSQDLEAYRILLSSMREFQQETPSQYPLISKNAE